MFAREGMEYAELLKYAESLEEKLVGVIKDAVAEPEEQHTLRTICERNVDPLNNLFLITDLIAGTQAYRHYRSQHFFPVYYRDSCICPGTQEMAQYVQTGHRMPLVGEEEDLCEHWEPGESQTPEQWRMSLEDAMSEAQRLFGDRQVCFSIVLKNGQWIQRYWCRPFEQYFT